MKANSKQQVRYRHFDILWNSSFFIGSLRPHKRMTLFISKLINLVSRTAKMRRRCHKPGVTSPCHRLQYYSHDVTNLLQRWPDGIWRRTRRYRTNWWPWACRWVMTCWNRRSPVCPPWSHPHTDDTACPGIRGTDSPPSPWWSSPRTHWMIKSVLLILLFLFFKYKIIYNYRCYGNA